MAEKEEKDREQDELADEASEPGDEAGEGSEPDQARDEADGEDDAEDAAEDDDGDGDDGDDDDDDGDDDADDADEDDEDDDDDDADEDDDAGDDDDSERVASVAKALGVGEDDDAEAEDAAERRPMNRAERRRRRALKRRGMRNADDEAAAPRDKNKKKRAELLERRRKAAQAQDEGLPEGRLLASEMVDDALARGTDAFFKWARHNWKVLQWAIVVAVVAGIGALWWSYRSESIDQVSSDALAEGVQAEQGTVIPEADDDRNEDQKKADVRTIFASYDEQRDAALEAYRKVAGRDSGAAILAKLGEAGVLLHQRKWDEALAAYDDVLGTELAAADMDVKARALEGKGFAQENKGQLDEARASFEQIGELPSDGFKALSKYHRARVHVSKGEKDQAKELLAEARKDLEKVKIDALRAGAQSPYRWLEEAIDEELKAIDPEAVPDVPPSGGALPQELQRKLMEQGLQPGMPTP